MQDGKADGAGWFDDPDIDSARRGLRARLKAIRASIAAFLTGSVPAMAVAWTPGRRMPGATGTAGITEDDPPPPPTGYVAAPSYPDHSHRSQRSVRSASERKPAAGPGHLLGTRLAREVSNLVASLGSTRGAIAASLEAAHIRTAPQDPQRTPISLFVAAVIGADPNVKAASVRDDAVVVDLRAWWRPPVIVELSQVVHDFVVAFDAGCYPALLRDELRHQHAD